MALLLLNVAWLVLAALSIGSFGAIILQLPPEMLPQWYLGLMTIAMVGAAIWLTAVAYERLRDDSETAADARRALDLADLLEASTSTLDRGALVGETAEAVDGRARPNPAARDRDRGEPPSPSSVIPA